MLQLASAARGSSLLDRLGQPLGLPQFTAFSAGAVGAGTLYCQIWCAVAFPPVHLLPMPLKASVTWSIAAILPWVASLELAKRRFAWTSSPRLQALAVVLLFLTAAAAAVVLELGLDELIGMDTREMPNQLAAQVTAAAVCAAILFGWPSLRAAGARPAPDQAATEILAMAASIRWIEAAGNYVQVHGRNGASLHRATMRELEETLDRTRFRRIHRSAIVSLDSIESRILLGSSPAVRLSDGTVLKVSRRFAANLA